MLKASLTQLFRRREGHSLCMEEYEHQFAQLGADGIGLHPVAFQQIEQRLLQVSHVIWMHHEPSNATADDMMHEERSRST